MADERARCKGCGTYADEWDEAQGGSRDAYVAHPHRCPGCEALESLEEQMRSVTDGSMHGMKLGLVRPDDPVLDEE